MSVRVTGSVSDQTRTNLSVMIKSHAPHRGPYTAACREPAAASAGERLATSDGATISGLRARRGSALPLRPRQSQSAPRGEPSLGTTHVRPRAGGAVGRVEAAGAALRTRCGCGLWRTERVSRHTSRTGTDRRDRAGSGIKRTFYGTRPTITRPTSTTFRPPFGQVALAVPLAGGRWAA